MNNPHVGTDTSTSCATHYPIFKSISWSAILVGALVAIGLSFLMNLFTLSIGLSAFSVSPTGDTAFAVGGFVGLVIGTIVIMFVSGWVAGYLGRPYVRKRNLGEVYGFAAWSVALILTILLSTHVANFVTKTNMNTSANITATTENNTPVVSADKKANGTNITINAEKAKNTLGLIGFITFFLFFVGALASSFGGHCGMRSCRKDSQGCGCGNPNCKC